MDLPNLATMTTKIPPMITSITPGHDCQHNASIESLGLLPIVEARPAPTESIKGAITALLAAPNIYCTKYFEAITAVRCSGMTSGERLATHHQKGTAFVLPAQ